MFADLGNKDLTIGIRGQGKTGRQQPQANFLPPPKHLISACSMSDYLDSRCAGNNPINSILFNKIRKNIRRELAYQVHDGGRLAAPP